MTATALSQTPLASAFPSDQTLTEQELEQARLFLAQTQNAVIGATKGLSDAQWNFRPAPDRWSIAENLEHVVIVQERVLGPLLGQLANAPAPPADRDYAQVDAIVISQFSVRLNKFSTPEAAQPGNQAAPLALLGRLKANCIALLGHLELTPGLRRHAIEAPPMKAVSKGVYQMMDGYQWILATAAHTERHCKQMLEVMADPGYPAR